jgi:hypothetical protein
VFAAVAGARSQLSSIGEQRQIAVGLRVCAQPHYFVAQIDELLGHQQGGSLVPLARDWKKLAFCLSWLAPGIVTVCDNTASAGMLQRVQKRQSQPTGGQLRQRLASGSSRSYRIVVFDFALLSIG